MKKHIAFMISCIMLAVCFSFPVFAVGQAQRRATTTSWGGTEYGNPSVSGVSLFAVASQLYGYADVANSNLTQHAGRQDVVVTVTLSNSNDSDVGLYGLYVWSKDNTTTVRNINDFGVIAGDVVVQVNSPVGSLNSNFGVNGTETNTYVGNGTLGTSGYEYLVIPARKSISFSFYYSTYYGSSSSTDYVLSSLEVGCHGYITGDIPHGIAVDNSDVINTLNDLLSDGNGYSLYDLLSYLDIPNIVATSGSSFSYDSYNLSTANDGSSLFTVKSITSNPYLINRDVEIDPQLDDSYLYNDIYCVDQYVYLIFRFDKSKKMSTYYLGLEVPVPFSNITASNFTLDIDENDIYYAYPQSLTNTSFRLILQSKAGNSTQFVAPDGTSIYKFKVTYYFNNASIDSSDNFVAPVYSTSKRITVYNGSAFTDYDSTYFPSIVSGLSRIYDLLFGESSTNDQISDDSVTVSDTESQIHQQEQQWYSDNETAIEATGLSNFEFSSGELDGLTQLRLQFSQVWGALGDWTLVYIFVLSLSLATFILRHRPTTKAQQRMADSAKYRQDVRNRSAVQDARASNNSNGFSDEIWRRAGYR